MGVPLVQVDAFADGPFTGNPAAVCPLDGPRDEAWMQRVAAEMNLSETAFVLQRSDGDFDLRWFTPAVEVELCGHATLASAHVLWEDGRIAADAEARFHTRSGPLRARRDGDWIVLDFPARPARVADVPDTVSRAVGVDARASGRSDVGYVLEVAGEAIVRAATPDFALLGSRPDGYVILTAPATSGDADFVSRYFAPPAGIDEDPVTGAAHCTLGPWWSERLGRDALVGRQVSARGGTVHVRVAGDRVLLGGRAVTVLRGEFLA